MHFFDAPTPTDEDETMVDPDDLRNQIADALEQASHPELAAIARLAADELDRSRPAIYDRHGVLREWPPVRDAIEAWIADPAPKLGRLRIRVREESNQWPGVGPQLEIGLAHRYTAPNGQPGELVATRLLHRMEVTEARGPRQRVIYHLHTMHLEAIDLLRRGFAPPRDESATHP